MAYAADTALSPDTIRAEVVNPNRTDTLQPDMDAHYETYNAFVKYALLFVLHVAIILVLLAYFFV